MASSNGNGAHRHVPSDDDVITLYHWLSIPRVAVVAVSAGAIALFWSYRAVNFDPKPVLFVLIPVFVLSSGWIAVIVHRRVRPWLLLHVQLALDLLGVSAGVYLTGGLRSPFLPLYFLVVISAGLVSLRTVVAVAASAAAAFLAIVAAEQSALIPAVVGMTMELRDADVIGIVIFLLIVGLIAFQSNYYFTRVREKDEEVLKLKDEFLFRTVHDLRSPSTVINFTLENYREQGYLEKYPEIREDLERIKGAVSRMARLIEDLLRIGAGERADVEFKKDRVDLPGLVAEVVAELRPLMDSRGIVVEHDDGDAPAVLGDADKLKQVFNNFVDNAVKYNRDGGRIRIVHRTEGRMLATDIADTGIGISPESLRKLFTPYFRGDIGKEIQGTGLGLYMTRKFVQKMGGRIEAASTKNEGTTFTILLPLA